MIIEICGRNAALARVAGAKVRTAVISITSTDEADVAFPANKTVAPVLRLKFNDLTEALDDEGIPCGRPLPEQTDFDGLRAFIDQLDCDRLIVHCWEGVSRSAAVAAAIHGYRGGVDTLITHANFAPNPRVCMMACRELGIPLSGMDYCAVPNGDGAWTLVGRYHAAGGYDGVLSGERDRYVAGGKTLRVRR